jgi:hypothetical protein
VVLEFHSSCRWDLRDMRFMYTRFLDSHAEYTTRFNAAHPRPHITRKPALHIPPAPASFDLSFSFCDIGYMNRDVRMLRGRVAESCWLIANNLVSGGGK